MDLENKHESRSTIPAESSSATHRTPPNAGREHSINPAFWTSDRSYASVPKDAQSRENSVPDAWQHSGPGTNHLPHLFPIQRVANFQRFDPKPIVRRCWGTECRKSPGLASTEWPGERRAMDSGRATRCTPINDWNAAGQYSPRQTLVFLPTFARVSKVTKPGTDELPFEDALNRLESIVESMESDDLPLEQLLTRFEEGARLSRLCQQRLADAVVKIQKLEQDLSGDLTLKPVAVANED